MEQNDSKLMQNVAKRPQINAERSKMAQEDRGARPGGARARRPRESLIMAPRRPRAPGGTSWPRGGI